MSLNLSTDSLRTILALSEKRDTLLAELQKVETRISSALEGRVSANAATLGHKTGNGRKPGARPTLRKGAPAKRRKRGHVKELILAGLREAGEAGIAVKHLAAKIGIKPQNVHVWFHTTGKKGGFTEALGRGVYRLKESIGVESPVSSLKAPKPKLQKTTRKSKRSNQT